MKKITLVLFTLLTLLPLGAWADETVEGIIYSLNGSNATVTGFTDETKSSVTSIIIPNSITIGEAPGTNYDVTAIADEAFSGYTDVESISIGENVTSMGNNTLANCKELLTLTIKNSTLFESLSINFAQTQIPSGLTIVYKGLRYKHYGEWSGTNNYFAVGNGNNGKGYDQSTADGNLVVLEKICDINVTTIANNAFYGVGDSKTIQLPASITTISNTSFVNNKLSAFSIANANTNFSENGGVLFSKDGKELISFPTQKGNTYTIPNGVTTIGKDAFNNHQSLTSITIPE
ncbi:MAG: leucine-rich repeat protein [Prevotella sp.]|nr:leucine-rich repeat protein [Prevotella sp.]